MLELEPETQGAIAVAVVGFAWGVVDLLMSLIQKARNK